MTLRSHLFNPNLEEWVESTNPNLGTPLQDENRRQLLIKQIPCKRAITSTALTGVTHTINPYIGCLFGCTYCYAKFMNKYHKGEEKWGAYLDIKTGLPQKLKSQLRRIHPVTKKRIRILLCSVTDLFQPISDISNFITQILTTLIQNAVSFTILTKSPKVLHYSDLIANSKNAEIGISISTLNPRIQQSLEPNSSNPILRLGALTKLSAQKIATYGFLSPILPNTRYDTLEELIIRTAETGVKYILIDKMNLHHYLDPHFYRIFNQLKPLNENSIPDNCNLPNQNSFFFKNQKLCQQKIHSLSKTLEIPIQFAK